MPWTNLSNESTGVQWDEEGNHSYTKTRTNLTRLEPVLYVDMIVGSIAVLSNLIILLAIFTQKSEQTKKPMYILCIALAVADLIVGISFCEKGASRLIHHRLYSYIEEFTVTVCLRKGTPYLTAFANHLTGVCILCVALERYVAQCYPFWYKSNWNLSKSVKLAVGAYIYSLLATVAGVLGTLGFTKDHTLRYSCEIVEVFPGVYISYVMLSAIVYICVSLALLLLARMGGKRFLKNGVFHQPNATVTQRLEYKNQMKLQLHVTYTMSIVVVCSLLLVVVPGVFLLLVNGFKVHVMQGMKPFARYLGALMGVNASIKLPVLVYMLNEIRSAISDMIGFLLCRKGNTVQPDAAENGVAHTIGDAKLSIIEAKSDDAAANVTALHSAVDISTEKSSFWGILKKNIRVV